MTTDATKPTRMLFPGLIGCRECTLCETRTKVVAGYGVFPNRVMLIGEHPGYDEDKHPMGIPMIGPSGDLLRRVLDKLGVDLDQLFRTNVNLCATPQNRKAAAAELNKCRKWLDMQIAKCDPDLIIAMGDAAWHALEPHENAITAVRGNPFRREVLGRMRLIVPVLHPAAVVRNEGAYLADFTQDLTHAFEWLDKGLPEAVPFNSIPATWEDIQHVITNAEVYGFDLETTGPLTPRKRPIARKQEIVSIGVAAETGKGYVYSMPDHREVPERVAYLKASMFSERQKKVISNVNFEKHVMLNYGIPIRGYYDTLLEAWLLADTPKSLKDAFHREFGVEMMHIEEVIGTGRNQRNMRDATIDNEALVITYSAQDPDASLRLHNVLYPMVVERGMEQLYLDLELPFADVIVEMERNGMLFDASVLTEAGQQLIAAHEQALVRLFALCGVEFNPNSHPQVRALLYQWAEKGATPGAKLTQKLAQVEHPFHIPLPKRLKPGEKPGTDKVALAEHIASPFVRGTMTARGLYKMRSTYIEGLPRQVDTDQRIHASINQAGTITGRVSTSEPNLANIPARKRDDADIPIAGSFIRTAFTVAPGNYMYAPDLGQIEMRMAAHLSGDKGMIEVLSDPNGDIHVNTAKSMFKTNQDALIMMHGEHIGDCPLGCECGRARWKNMRYLAKTIGFGCVPMDSEALTPTGWKSYDELSVGDIVMGYDANTKQTKWTKILAKAKYENAPITKMASSNWSASSTPNHRWYGTRRTSDGRNKYSIYDVMQTSQISTESTITLAAKIDAECQLPITPAEAAIIGWVWSDGRIKRSTVTSGLTSQAGGRKRGLTVSIYQSKSAGKDAIERVLMDIPHKVYHHGQRIGMNEYRLDQSYARNLFNRANIWNTTKEQFVLQLGTAHVEAFLQAVIDAEGTPAKNTSVITQNIGPMFDAIMVAAAMCGYVPSISENGWYGDNRNVKIRLCKPYVTGQRITKTAEGTADVWCIKTELNTWVMKQHDQIMITGNTLYGLSAEGLLMRTPTLELTIDEARDFIEKFYDTYPGLRDWQMSIRKDVYRNGYYTTMLGRRRYFPEITAKDRKLASEAANAAVNFPVQGGAADYFKTAVLAVRQKMRDLGLATRFVNQVYDEIDMEGPKGELERLALEVVPVMCSVIQLRVPVMADLDYGDNWGDMHTWKAV